MTVDTAIITKMFEPLTVGNWTEFMFNVRDDVSWTIGNPMIHTFPLAGVHDKAGFLEVFQPFSECFDDPIALHIANIIPAPSGNSAAIEMTINSTAKDGSEYLQYYAWVAEFDPCDPPLINTVRAYLDTALVRDIMEKNGKGE